jgi:pimeloyl-ACP methyl ester carboxylesterase
MKWSAKILVLSLLVLSQTSWPGDAVSAKTQYASVNGVRIAYRSLGHGTPIVLATRFRGTVDTWDPLFLDLLARNHRVIAFDYPGIGYSSGELPADLSSVASTIAGLARELELKSFTVLGWSWGGLVAQTLAVEHPDLVDAVILVGTNPPGEVAFAPTREFLDRAVKPVNDLEDEVYLFFEPSDAASRQAAKDSRERILARAGVTEHIPTRAEQIGPYFTAAQSFREDKTRLRARFGSLPTPKLILTGDNDTSLRGQNWFPLLGLIQHAQFIMYSQTGHAPQHQHPELVADQIETFLRLCRAK